MYAKRIPFTRDTNKGPQPIKKSSKKASKPVVEETVIEEPAKIEVVDEITEPTPELVIEEETNGES